MDDASDGGNNDDETLSGTSRFSQWDVTNTTDFDAVFRNQTEKVPLLPPEEAQPENWPMAVLSLFVLLAALLCAGTWIRRCRAHRYRTNEGYEAVHNLSV